MRRAPSKRGREALSIPGARQIAPLAQLNRENREGRGKHGSTTAASLAESGPIPSDRGGTVAVEGGGEPQAALRGERRDPGD